MSSAAVAVAGLAALVGCLSISKLSPAALPALPEPEPDPDPESEPQPEPQPESKPQPQQGGGGGWSDASVRANSKARKLAWRAHRKHGRLPLGSAQVQPAEQTLQPRWQGDKGLPEASIALFDQLDVEGIGTTCSTVRREIICRDALAWLQEQETLLGNLSTIPGFSRGKCGGRAATRSGGLQARPHMVDSAGILL